MPPIIQAAARNPTATDWAPAGGVGCAAMTRAKRVGILTGGGDVPGLNSVIKSVVYQSTALGYEAIGLRRGWQALTHLRPGDGVERPFAVALDRTNTRTIDRTGGTVLHTSRTNPRRVPRAELPEWLSAE